MARCKFRDPNVKSESEEKCLRPKSEIERLFDFSDPMQKIAFLKNIGLAGGFLFIVANGTKEWAIEREKKYVRL